MKAYALVAGFVLALLATGCNLLASKEPGLALVLRSRDLNAAAGKAESQWYRMLWLSPTKGPINIGGSGNSFILPSGTHVRMLLIDGTGATDQMMLEPGPVPLPGGQLSTADLGPLPAEGAAGPCSPYARAAVLFVGPTLVSTEWTTDACSSGGQAAAYDQLRVIALDRSGDQPISAVFGKAGGEALRRGAREFVESARARGVAAIDCMETEPNELNWGFVRRHGAWVVRGRLSRPLSAGCRGEVFDFDLPIHPDGALVWHDRLTPPWPNIKEALPDAIDAYSSPDGGMLVVHVPGELLVYTPRRGRMGEAVQQAKLGDEERVVMARWATGSREDLVMRWLRAQAKR